MPKTASFSFDKHIGVIGETQSGKTVLAGRMVENLEGKAGAILVIDFEDLGEFGGVRIDGYTSEDRIVELLNSGSKVRFVPDTDKEIRIKQIERLFKLLKNQVNRMVYVVADEIQEYGDAKKNAFDVYAIRGLKNGVLLISITQRPAKLSNTIASQTKRWFFFEVNNFEERYFKEYSLPYEDIIERFNSLDADKVAHSFIVYERGKQVSKPMKLDL